MKKNILLVSILSLTLFLGGCSMSLQHEPEQPAMIKKLLTPPKGLSSAIKTKHSVDQYIFMGATDKLATVLEKLGQLENNFYVLRGKNIEIAGPKNFKIHSFMELKKYVRLLTNYNIKITKNKFRKGLPKIVEVEEQYPATVLDSIKFNSKNLQIPMHLFLSLSNYADGWKIVDFADVKKIFNSKQYVNFNGTLREFIEYFAKNNDLFVDFNYKKKEIIYSKYKTRHFSLKLVTERYKFRNKIDADIDSSISSGKDGGSIEAESEYDILKSFGALLDKIIPKKDPEQYWSILNATNELVVKSTRKKLDTITKVVNTINETALAQIDMRVTVYEVSLDKKYQYGINWGYVNNVLNSTGGLDKITALSTNSAVPALDTSLVSPNIFKYTGEGLNMLVSLLNTFGNTVLSYQIPLKTTNNIPAVYNLANKTGYVSKFTLSTDATSGDQISIEQDSVIGGQYVYIKPTILNNQILMSLKMVFSNVNNIVKQDFGNGQYIQTPDLSKNVYNQNIVLHTGDKIIIGGIVQRYNKKGYDGLTNENSMLAPLFGVKNKTRQNKEVVIVIEAKKE